MGTKPPGWHCGVMTRGRRLVRAQPSPPHEEALHHHTRRPTRRYAARSELPRRAGLQRPAPAARSPVDEPRLPRRSGRCCARGARERSRPRLQDRHLSRTGPERCADRDRHRRRRRAPALVAPAGAQAVERSSSSLIKWPPPTVRCRVGRTRMLRTGLTQPSQSEPTSRLVHSDPVVTPPTWSMRPASEGQEVAYRAEPRAATAPSCENASRAEETQSRSDGAPRP